MKKLFLFAVVTFFCQSGFSQSSVDQKQRTESLNDPKFLEFKKQHDDRLKANGIEPQTTVYFGYDEQLKSFFIDGIISSQAPKANGTSTKKEYVTILNDWLSKNQHLLKPEHKDSLITE